LETFTSTPAEPPARDVERDAEFRLWLAGGVGPERRRALLDRFGSASAVFNASRKQLDEVRGLPGDVIDGLLDPKLGDRVAAERERMVKLGVRWISMEDDAFPPLLKEIPRPPIALTVQGEVLPEEVCIGIVGSRRCTPYGREVAAKLAADLARAGVTVVSGLARGLDAAAHETTLEAGGRTIAVLASGLANVYPPEHHELALSISKQGAVMTEAALDGPPIGNLFPLRNRIISGLSRGVVVVEAAEKSGALSTAFHAIDQNREVFAVPGRLGDPTSAGCNELIRKGATMVRSVDDILEAIGPISGGRTPPSKRELAAREKATQHVVTPPPGMNDMEAAIWQALGLDGLDADTLADRVGLPAPSLASLLFMMEMRGVVTRQPGNRYVRKPR
jgi:DNA processing protein